MKGLTISIKQLKAKKQDEWIGSIVLFLLILIGIVLLPLFLIFWLIKSFINLVFNSNTDEVSTSIWLNVASSKEVDISYRYLLSEEIPECLLDFCEDQGLMFFKTVPETPFFEGFFSDFKVERDDGLFVQKVILDEMQTTIESAPLFFFKYRDQSFEEIIDLLGYEIDTKGNPFDFVIKAKSKNKHFEIRLTK